MKKNRNKRTHTGEKWVNRQRLRNQRKKERQQKIKRSKRNQKWESFIHSSLDTHEKETETNFYFSSSFLCSFDRICTQQACSPPSSRGVYIFFRLSSLWATLAADKTCALLCVSFHTVVYYIALVLLIKKIVFRISSSIQFTYYSVFLI